MARVLARADFRGEALSWEDDMHRSFWKRASATLAAALLSNALLVNAAAAGRALPVMEAGIFESAYDAQAVQDTLYVLMED